MKTEQEQTKQMLKALCDKFQCSAVDRSPRAKSCRQCEEIVEALVQAGYGDVSEYKKALYNAQRNQRNIEELEVLAFDSERLVQMTNEENDKLKSEIKQLQTENAELKQQVKQAQIDVLNKLQTNMVEDGIFVEICNWHINKLIEEVQKCIAKK